MDFGKFEKLVNSKNYEPFRQLPQENVGDIKIKVDMAKIEEGAQKIADWIEQNYDEIK